MKEPLLVSGTIDYIGPGYVRPAGNSGRYLVDDRDMTGSLEDVTVDGVPLKTDIEGTVVIIYDANVAIENQKGPVHGTITLSNADTGIDYTAKFTARSDSTINANGDLELDIDGRLTFHGNAHGKADFDATIVVDLDDDGHIVGILQNHLIIDGSWDPDEEASDSADLWA